MFRGISTRVPMGNAKLAVPQQRSVSSRSLHEVHQGAASLPSFSMPTIAALTKKPAFPTPLKPLFRPATSIFPQRFFSASSQPPQTQQPNAVTDASINPNIHGSHDNHFEEAMRAPNEPNARNQVYMLLGSARFIAASAVRVLIVRIVASMSASADVLAMGSLEVDVGKIPEGTTFVAKWRGKPVFIRHRTDEDIALAQDVQLSELRDPQPDSVRAQDPKWLVVLGVCTHLGCVPINNAGDYKGWFCPCHGSHYDTSGRIRKGPAPLNLEIPTYKFLSPSKLLLG